MILIANKKIYFVEYTPWIVNLNAFKVCIVKNQLHNAANTIALNVKQGRKSVGLSQEAFAYEAGIDRTYVSQIERGIANPSLSVLCKIADVFDISLIELIT